VSDKSGVQQASISLPKGGGAIKGIGETFQANLFSGTGNYSIPLAVSPGRNGFGPSLSLQYSSGNGNGPFGLGWQLSIPRIARKTEKGLPAYDDDLDVFVMSGAEDLVPYLKKIVDPVSGDETWVPEDPLLRQSHTVSRYRPRTEGLFARIERWRHNVTGDVHWRSITKDNVTSIYGGRASTRLSNPGNEHQVYEWLLQETFDSTGNHILYEYARDNPQLYSNEDPSLHLNRIFEHNRRPAQLYLRRIYYGNLPSPLIDEQGQPVTYSDGTAVGHLRETRRYAFEVVFDYGDWEIPTKSPHPDPIPAGEQELFGPDTPIRSDVFSSFRARFEVRTLRRCRRVLMFHHFAELSGPTLVRSTNFEYRNDPDTLLSFLTTVTVTGYKKESSGTYRSAPMPPVTFKYSEFRPHEQHYQSVVANGNDMPPLALNDPNMALVDLFGDGLPDVLQGNTDGFRFWRNLGGGRLDRPRPMPQIPSTVAIGEPGVSLGDMNGDGQADLLVHSSLLPGFFETTPNGTWRTFKPYEVFPSFNLGDPNVRLVDLTGDGLSDALMTQGDRFLWFECLGEKGFAPSKQIARKRDLDQFPDVFFDDQTGRVRLADMSGDGLSDIVLVHNGRIDYWPSLGYGQFGKRITMENAPHLEVDFDPKRLFLADLNGTGCADLVYVDFDRVHFWFNQSGNSWSNTQTIHGTPVVSNIDSIQFADVFGTGTATLVWSYDFVGQSEANYKALDFCGGVKPYVLTEMSNNMGATTRVSYAPSTRYFLEDEANGTPWLTKLAFPVQVVDKVEVLDHISKTKLVTTYKYHHGYFDGREREFRGFGRVDQFDTETFEDFSGPGLHGESNLFDNKLAAFHAPPIETRSWFHTGIYFDEDLADDPFHDLTHRYRTEFYAGDDEAFTLDEHHVETSETPHEAYRALRAALLRTEVYARDGSDKAEHPYTVTESRYRVRQVQPKQENHHAVYFSHQLETLTCHYERNPTDPRLNHAMTLEVDSFGNTLKSLEIAYGRRQPDDGLPAQADRDKQTQVHITYSENTYTKAIDDATLDPDNHRTPMPSESRSYELTGLKPANDATRFSVDEWIENDFARLNQTIEIAYEKSPDETQQQKRLIEHIRTYYRKNDLTELLPLGELETLALPGESFKLAFTPALLTHVYGDRVTDSMLADEGGYVHTENDANWWVPSGRVFFSPNESDSPSEERAFAQQHFYKACRIRDPFGTSAFTQFDAYDLFSVRTTDALGNQVIAERDYRVLQPVRLVDPNGNQSLVAFDTLGLVVGSAVMGKAGQTLGDLLDSAFNPDPAPEQLAAFITNPREASAVTGESVPTQVARELLGNATTRVVYDLERFNRTGEPPLTATLARETHFTDPGGSQTKIQISFSYSDGFGREIQKKIETEPGTVADGSPAANPRWVGNGWTIFNNKGKPVRKYEPFFSATHHFEFAKTVGVSPVLFYDPVGRIVATLDPNHTWEKFIFDPWRQTTFDVNDTVTLDPRTDHDVRDLFTRLPDADYLPTWFSLRTDPAHAAEAASVWPDPEIRAFEREAAEKAGKHAGTPTVVYFDSLGRPFLTIAHNKFERRNPDDTIEVIEEKYSTRVTLDIEGNQRDVIDAQDRIIMRYEYDMLGNQIHVASMEAGDRWILNNVAGNRIYAWDSREHRFRTAYDELQRPVTTHLSNNSGPESLIGQSVYGESQTNPEARNLRGKVVQVFDQAGVVFSEEYDFKGNLLRTRRRLSVQYNGTIDWTANPETEPDEASFVSTTNFDALNRPVATTTPDGSVYLPTFNAANLLKNVSVNLHGDEQQPTVFVTNINHNAKGQRTLIEYENGVKTRYEYDLLTSRLVHLETLRGDARLQDLSYTYDPTGNISHIEDDAQQTIFFNNQVVTPSNDYIYDALYRLIRAEGREHIGQASFVFDPTDGNYRDYPFLGHRVHSNDGNAMRRYSERYDYDAVGNFLQMVHQAQDGNWTRAYEYNETSLIESNKTSNRLSNTTVGPNAVSESYSHDAHGNMTSMQHLTLMEWSFNDELSATSRQVVNNGTPEKTFYVYDAAGNRVRKVTERQNGTRKNERIYIGVFEIFREYEGTGTSVTLERETLHVLDDKQRIAIVETRTRGNDGSPEQLIRYQFGNHLGSASLELDDAGQIISYEEYYPYGSTSYQAGPGTAEVSRKRYRFTQKERDEETGFSYHAARYYASWLGRWVSCDPIGLKAGVDLYVYVGCNPVGLIDPNGTEDLPSWYLNTTKETKDAAEIQRRLQNLDARAQEIQQLLDLTKPRIGPSSTGNPEDAYLTEGISLDPDQIKAISREQSLIAHARGTLITMQKINERRNEITPWIDVAEEATGKKWEDLSDSAQSYWKMKVGHRDWQVKSNLFLLMTDAIVKESQSTDVQIFQGVMVGAIFGPMMTPKPKLPAPPPATTGTVISRITAFTGTRAQFRDYVLAKLQREPNNPLRFLLNASGTGFKRPLSRAHAELIDNPDVWEAGHIVSDKIGGNRLMIQSAWENQVQNITVEHVRVGGAVLANPALEVGGFPVAKSTVLWWEQAGLLPRGTAANARVIQ